jgi:hypothetical protein
MPKEKLSKKSTQLRHTPLESDLENSRGLKAPRHRGSDEEDEDHDEIDQPLPPNLGSRIYNQAKEQRIELMRDKRNKDDDEVRILRKKINILTSLTFDPL